MLEEHEVLLGSDDGAQIRLALLLVTTISRQARKNYNGPGRTIANSERLAGSRASRLIITLFPLHKID